MKSIHSTTTLHKELRTFAVSFMHDNYPNPMYLVALHTVLLIKSQFILNTERGVRTRKCTCITIEDGIHGDQIQCTSIPFVVTTNASGTWPLSGSGSPTTAASMISSCKMQASSNAPDDNLKEKHEQALHLKIFCIYV